MTTTFDRVYVLYPRGQRTGGPEALHQLVHTLRAQDVEAYLVPLASTRNAPRVAAYDHYDAPEQADVDDVPGVAVVAPESNVHRLEGYKRAQPVCWWLSIDYSVPFFSRQEMKDRRFARSIGVAHQAWAGSFANSAYRHLLSWAAPRGFMRRAVHMSQSAYARAYLQERVGIGSSVVSDYIPRDVIDAVAHEPELARGRSIAYNPKKASWAPQLLGGMLPGVEWRPIQNLDATGVARLLHTTTAYFDPGFHPGRDRMPREAALLGAITVVARRGAGSYWDDVPIPWNHKVSTRGDFAANAAVVLRSVLDAPDEAAASQAHYRRWIAEDRERFAAEVHRVFREGRWEDDSPFGAENP